MTHGSTFDAVNAAAVYWRVLPEEERTERALELAMQRHGLSKDAARKLSKAFLASQEGKR